MIDQADDAARRRFAGLVEKGVSASLRFERAKAKRTRRAERARPSNKEVSHASGDGFASGAGGAKPADLIGRLYETCTGQLDRIEAKLAEMGDQSVDLAELDKATKMLSGLTRTLELLSDLRKSHEKEAAEGDDNVDPDRLRKELADRLHGLCKGAQDAAGAAKPQSGGD